MPFAVELEPVACSYPDHVCHGYVLRMMPDYVAEAIWRVGGICRCVDARLTDDLEADLKIWVLEWADFHDCDVRDDTHKEWVIQGRKLYRRAKDQFAIFGTTLLADFEGSIEEQVARRSRWSRRYRSDASDPTAQWT